MFYSKPCFPKLNLRHPLAKDLLAAWAFYEKSGDRVWDLSGNNNHLTAFSHSWGGGKFGSSLNCSGSPAYLRTTNQIDFRGAKIITVTFWAYWSVNANDDALLMEHSSNYNSVNGTFIVNLNSSSPPSVAFASIHDGVVAYRVETFSRPSAATWHFYAFVFKNGGSPDIKVYLDGVEQTTTIDRNDSLGGIGFRTDFLYFFSRGGSSLFGSGSIDDIRIYSQELSAPEISRIYANPWEIYSENTPPIIILSASLGGANNAIYSFAKIQQTVIRPASDISLGSWTNSPLFSKIDEVSPDDSDLITSSTSPVNDTFEVALTPTGTPINRNNHNIRYRLQKRSTSRLDMRVSLYEGTTLIASGIHANIPRGISSTGFSLTAGQASAITDYSNLRLRFTASTAGF